MTKVILHFSNKYMGWTCVQFRGIPGRKPRSVGIYLFSRPSEMPDVRNRVRYVASYLHVGQRVSRGLQLEQMLCPFKHWVIGGAMKLKQTGHSRRLARLLLKSDLNLRRSESLSLAAISCVYNLLLVRIIRIKWTRYLQVIKICCAPELTGKHRSTWRR